MIRYEDIPKEVTETVFSLAPSSSAIMERVFTDLTEVSPNCVAIAVIGSFANGGMILRQEFGQNRSYHTDFDMVPVYEVQPDEAENAAVKKWVAAYFKGMPLTEKRQLVPFLRTEQAKNFDFCPIIKYGAQYRLTCPPLDELQQPNNYEKKLNVFPLLNALDPQYPLTQWHDQVKVAHSYLQWLYQEDGEAWLSTITQLAYHYSGRTKLKPEHFFVGTRFKSTQSEKRRTDELIREISSHKWQLFYSWLLETATSDQPHFATIFPHWVLDQLGLGS